jgi:hypothetical protein
MAKLLWWESPVYFGNGDKYICFGKSLFLVIGETEAEVCHLDARYMLLSFFTFYHPEFARPGPHAVPLNPSHPSHPYCPTPPVSFQAFQ